MMMKLRLSQLLLFLAGVSCVSVARAQQQFPMMDRVADRVIQKYQQSPCSELKAQRERPKGPQEQRALQLLRDDPQMRRAFIDRVAAPIANKMFECGMIP
jgi:hypothetical protein